MLLLLGKRNTGWLICGFSSVKKKYYSMAEKRVQTALLTTLFMLQPAHIWCGSASIFATHLHPSSCSLSSFSLKEHICWRWFALRVPLHSEIVISVIKHVTGSLKKENLMKCIDVPNKEATIAKAHTAVLWNVKSPMEQHSLSASLQMKAGTPSGCDEILTDSKCRKVKLTLTQTCYTVKGSFL